MGDKLCDSRSPHRQVTLPRSGVFKAIREDDPLWRPDGEKTINVNPLQQVVTPDVSFWEANEDFRYYQLASQFKPTTQLEKLIWKLHVEGCNIYEISAKVPGHTPKQIWSAIQRIITEMLASVTEP